MLIANCYSPAGPLCNLAIAIFCIFVFKIFFKTSHNYYYQSHFFLIAAHINLTLFVFNLLPIPPLDGYHVFSEIFPGLKSHQYTQYGMFLMMVIFLIPAFGSTLSLMAGFLLRVFL